MRPIAAVFLCVLAILAASAEAPARADVIGAIQTHRVEPEDTFVALARRYGLGYVELAAANPGVHPWLPEAGTRLVLPTAHVLPDAPRQGIVVNLGDMRLYRFPAGGGTPSSHPIGIGREGWQTPTGRTSVVLKRRDPVWIPPESVRAENPDLPRAVPPGPNNPLGRFALNLGWPSYVIHGTNRPAGIGRRVSHGCLRLYPEDIEALFAAVAVGVPVRVVDQPVKLGWHGGELYLEAHPTTAQADALQIDAAPPPAPVEGLRERVAAAAGDAAARVDWEIVERTARQRRGIPVRVTY